MKRYIFFSILFIILINIFAFILASIPEDSNSSRPEEKTSTWAQNFLARIRNESGEEAYRKAKAAYDEAGNEMPAEE